MTKLACLVLIPILVVVVVSILFFIFIIFVVIKSPYLCCAGEKAFELGCVRFGAVGYRR